MRPSSQKPTNAMLSLLGSGKNTAKKARGEEGPAPLAHAYSELEKAKLELEQFHGENEDVIERYHALRQGVDDAVTQVKEQYLIHKDKVGATFHGFFLQQRRHVDAELLMKLVPDAREFVKYSIPMTQFDALIENGIIEEEIAEQVTSVEETVCSPRK